jgi:hypothetical protein
MRRLHLTELEDLPWWPKAFRDAATEYLVAAVQLGKPYQAALPLLLAALRRSEATSVLDLCSGAGGPWESLQAEVDIPILLSDRFPNPSSTSLSYCAEPVDATAVPATLSGFRTLFASFHHFGPEQARAILANAQQRGEGIAIFEATARTLPALLGMLFVPLLVWIVTPQLRPVRVSRYVFTYLLPILPLAILFDGVVSCLRTYTPAELTELTKGLESYHWEMGVLPIPRSPIPLTYLIGTPK